MNKYLMEFIGTFFLVLVIALTGNPLAIGAVITGLVYMGGYISGANYNPAVTLALLILKKIDSETALRYMAAQFFGGFAGAIVSFIITNQYFVPQKSADISTLPALIVEILFTFLLVSVVLHVAVSSKTKNNDYYGLAIGLTVIAIAFAGGPISGGVFNPAVGLGPILFDFASISGNMENLLLYLIGPFTGGALAALLYLKSKS